MSFFSYWNFLAIFERIWKDIPDDLSHFNSCRDMYLTRPHVETDGCYIGVTRYYREGENAFRDQNYKPVHLVVYYRYVRFFADGTVLVANTADPPQKIVSQLKNRHVTVPYVFKGTYTVNEMNGISITLQDKLNRVLWGKCFNVTYHMVFQLKKSISQNKQNTKLVWKKYTISYGDISNSEEEFDINSKAFPPLWYSRVKSYTAESQNPLV